MKEKKGLGGGIPRFQLNLKAQFSIFPISYAGAKKGNFTWRKR
jgi:hypothetical protein